MSVSDLNPDIVSALRNGEVGKVFSAALDYDFVLALFKVCDGVFAITIVEDELVAASAASKNIFTLATEDDISATTTVHGILAITSIETIAPTTAFQQILGTTASEGVIAPTAFQCISATVAPKQVFPPVAFEKVPSAATIELVGATAASKAVVSSPA